jgi:large subunit ribosomal protein L3
MTHLMVNDNRMTSLTKGEDIQMPVTILECPPLKIASIILYRKDAYGLHSTGQINAEKLEKETTRKITTQKKPIKQPDTKNIAEVRVLAYTQPKLTSIGKKKPEFFELGIGGTKPEEKLAFAQGLLGKEIKITDVFTEGQLVDITSITKGKGLQGPMRRFGLSKRSHKSQKAIRTPGSLGPWHGPRLYRVAHQGQMGFQQRVDRNKQIIKIDDDPTKINPVGGFMRYGFIKNQYLLIKGSVGGAHKRLITLTLPRLIITKLPKEPPQVVYTSTSSKQ